MRFTNEIRYVCVKLLQSHSTPQLCGLWPARLLCPWDSPGKSTGVGCHALLQGISQTPGLNPRLPQLLCCRQIPEVHYRKCRGFCNKWQIALLVSKGQWSHNSDPDFCRQKSESLYLNPDCVPDYLGALRFCV